MATPSLLPNLLGSLAARLPQIAQMGQHQAVATIPTPVPFAPTGLAGMAAVPDLGAPTSNVTVQSPAMARVAARDQLAAQGDGISHIENPWLRGFARVADVAGQIVAPNIERLIPGTVGNHAHELAKANAQIGVDQAQAQAAAQIQDQQAQAVQRGALATQEQAKAEALTDPHKATAPGHYILGADGTAAGYQDGDGGVHSLDDPTLDPEIAKVGNNFTPKTVKVAPADEKLNAQEAAVRNALWDKLAAAHHLPTGQFYEGMTRTDATQQAQNLNSVVGQQRGDTKVVIQENKPEATGATGTWSLATQADGKGGTKSVLLNSKTGEVKDAPSGLTKQSAMSNAKISNDEQKRADLAQNMNENINSLEEIAARRPELFGPLAGRLTDMKVATGTSDPDIAKLEVIKHQLGMVSQGVHGMRSSQGLEASANALVNGYHNSPGALKAALESARTSAQTFQADAQNPGKARSGADATVTPTSGKADYVYVPGKGLVKQ